MKVKETQTAKAGGYAAYFKELIRPGNKTSLKETKGGKRMMWRMVTDGPENKGGGQEIPCSAVWDLTDPRFAAAVGALGVPANKIKEVNDSGTIEKAMIYFEKMAQKRHLKTSVYVREDNGFGSSLKPFEGDFLVKFTGISSVDDNKKPIFTFKPGKQVQSQKTKGTFMTDDMNQFSADFVVTKGMRRGSRFTKYLNYSFVKDEDDEWMCEAESNSGKAFKSFLVLHKIMPEKINPDKHFDDPENGLPYLEKKLLEKNKTLLGTVNKGWLNKLKEPPEGEDDEDNEPVDVGEEKTASKQSRLLTKLTSMINSKVKEKYGKSAWTSDGDMSVTGESWFNRRLKPLMKDNKMPSDLEKLSVNQLIVLIKHLRQN